MIPRVFWDFTTSRVLTLERMSGANVTDSTPSMQSGWTRRQWLAGPPTSCCR